MSSFFIGDFINYVFYIILGVRFGSGSSSRSGSSSVFGSNVVFVIFNEGFCVIIKFVKSCGLFVFEKVIVFFFEFFDGFYGYCGSVVVDGGSVVSFVDGDGGVYDFGGDGVFLDDGLDMLVEVVVDVFILDDWCFGGGVDGVVGY